MLRLRCLLWMLAVLLVSVPGPNARAQALEGVWVGSEGRRPAIVTFGESPLLRRVLDQAQGPLRQVAADPARYRLQLIFTQINRGKKGAVFLRHHTLGLDTSRAFFTASLVKLPTAALALSRLRALGLDPATTTLHIGAASPCQAADSAAYRPLTVAELIDRSFVVSDNAAYNRLFEWLGPRQLEAELHRRDYGSARLRHRYNSACWNDPRGGGYLNPLSLRADGRTVLSLPARDETEWRPHTLRETRVDNFDFAQANFINLVDLHRMLLALVVPTALAPEQRFDLSADDYRRLHRALAALPTEVDSPWFDTSFYHAARMKYLVAGANADTLAALRRDSVLILNKVGLGYGFLVDCAYVIDFARRREFVLSAVLYANADGVIGDDVYEYESVGQPALGELGRLLLAHERRRRVSRPPKLSFFRQAWGPWAPPPREAQ